MLFNDYSTIITRVNYALFWPHFRLFSTFIVLVLCKCWFYLLCRFAWNTPFFVFGIVFITGGL